jgi:cold shock protein
VNDRIEGRVKWFNSTKGYGFIRPSEEAGLPNDTDVFVHYSAIEAKGYRTLKEGNRVEFAFGHTIKGYHAKEVVVLEEA